MRRRTLFAVGRDETPIFYRVSTPASEPAGPAVVFCDGIGCDGYVWKYLEPVLARHGQPLAAGWPGGAGEPGGAEGPGGEGEPEADGGPEGEAGKRKRKQRE